MIVQIMQSHVETGKWYLQHQPTHERADVLVAAIRDCDQISDAIRSTARLENGEIVIGAYRYEIGYSLHYWRRLYHHRQGNVSSCGVKLYPPRQRGGIGRAEKLHRKSRRRRQ